MAVQSGSALAQAQFPSGSFLSGPIRFEFAIYYSGSPKTPPMSALDARLRSTQGAPRLVTSLPDLPTGALVKAVFSTTAQIDYRPPDLKGIQYFGRGLSRDQAEALQRSEKVLILDFAHPLLESASALYAALMLAENVSRDTGGLLWDEETREIFTPDEWHKRRIESWQGAIPDVMKHTVIHAYRGDSQVRAITLGMAKFGAPDIVVNDFPWSSNRVVGNLINVFAQAVVEGIAITTPGNLDLNLRSIKNDSVRKSQTESLKPNADAVAKLHLFQGKWESGDPRNRIVEIGFDRYPGPDRYARQEAMLSALFGSEDSTVYVKHTAQLLAASATAREKLPGLREAFRRGLQPGEFILLKAPFKTTSGSNEWMWVEVTSWAGDEIRGLLKNEPNDVPELHAGQIVKVSQSQVFDYIRRDGKGREEGNETGKILKQQNVLK